MLASTENQILTARTRFNETVRPYNNHIKIFPNPFLLVCLDLKENHTGCAAVEVP
jgi:LemA protein